MATTDLRLDSNSCGIGYAGRRSGSADPLRNRTSEAKRNIVAHNFRRLEFLERPGAASRGFFATHSGFAGGLLFPVSSNFWGRGGSRFANRHSRKAYANTCRARELPSAGKGTRRCANLEFLSRSP